MIQYQIAIVGCNNVIKICPYLDDLNIGIIGMHGIYSKEQ